MYKVDHTLHLFTVLKLQKGKDVGSESSLNFEQWVCAWNSLFNYQREIKEEQRNKKEGKICLCMCIYMFSLSLHDNSNEYPHIL